MKVLVTGGTGVIGESLVRELSKRGHSVRVLSRNAGRDQTWWPANVEGWAGDVSNDETIRRSADGCDVIVHVAGIVAETPPDKTFQRINIDGTRWIVMEAERAGVRKLIYVSSLGAERGQSAYHKSKFVAEEVVRGFSRDGLVLRPGAVYGPGDEHISRLLQMVRSLPVIPTIGTGEQQFQPIWHGDLSRALAMAIERDDIRCQTLDIAGTELTSQNDLVARLRAITDRPAVQAPLPELFASWGLRALNAIGVDVPFNEAQLAMLTEGNVIPPGAVNALTDVFGVAPTKLADGLPRLANEQPEQLPSSGVGVLTRKRYWVDIVGGRSSADELFEFVKEHLDELLPPVVHVRSKTSSMEEGATLTLEIPLRGHIQVRVAEVAERHLTMLTLVGHPIAGAVRVLVEPRGEAVRFEIQVYDRPASMFDQLMLRTIGDFLQRNAWVGLAENVARAAGGTSSGVESASDDLGPQEIAAVEKWTAELSAQLSRNSTSSGRD